LRYLLSKFDGLREEGGGTSNRVSIPAEGAASVDASEVGDVGVFMFGKKVVNSRAIVTTKACLEVLGIQGSSSIIQHLVRHPRPIDLTAAACPCL
jgi:hypothetical protein